jgi:hypothetical protein
MSNLMTHKKIIYGVACLLPHRKCEHASMNVKAGSFHLLVLNHKVFGGKEFGKLRLDFVSNGHGFVVYGPMIEKKRVVKPSSVPV